MAQATIRDVAREAGASVASVSRALNGLEGVKPELRARVQAAAAKLAYTPHAGARNLSRARSDAVGVVLPDLHGEFFSEFLRGLDREASAHGLHLLLSNIHAGPHGAIEALHTLRGRVDGLIVMAPGAAPEHLAAHLPPSMPAILINCADANGAHPQLRSDNVSAAAVMTNHLLAVGRRRVVHLAGPADNVEAQEREQGYRAAMARAGLEPRVLPGDFSEEAGAAAANEILADPESCDALFAANDMMALGALSALVRAGVDVPGQVAIGGFDDIPVARMITPALTT
ncbi:MAG: LacI family DNA-binding transcriptional regulator, partial [Caulobacteraceae bacterium]|nr:LacI family DNA-binding transcriptional regulator [Caulobacter sp.]